jgi:hypothetical protein
MINAKLQNLYNIKNDIGTAIVNKGGTITESTPFYSYAGEIDNISTGGGSYFDYAAQDINGAKYEVYNGYDFVTNPTPNLSQPIIFNRWILNNNTTKTISFSNANIVINTGFNFNGPSTVLNNIGFSNWKNVTISSAVLNGDERYANSVHDFVYSNNTLFLSSGFSAGPIQTYLRRFDTSGVTNTSINVTHAVFFGSGIYAQHLALDDNYVYASARAFDPGGIKKYHRNNLVEVANRALGLNNTKVRNGFIYGASGTTFYKLNAETLQNEAVLQFQFTNADDFNLYSGTSDPLLDFDVSQDYLYISVKSPNSIRRFHLNNFEYIDRQNTTNNALALVVDGEYLYATVFATAQRLRKYHLNNFSFVSGISTNQTGTRLHIDNEFAYIMPGNFGTFTLERYYKNNLTFASTTSFENRLSFGDGFYFAVKGNTSQSNFAQITQTLTKSIQTFNNTRFYTITNIKE